MTDAAGSAVTSDMVTPGVVTTLVSDGDSGNTAAPGGSALPETSGNSDMSDVQDGSSSDTTAASVAGQDVSPPAAVPDESRNTVRRFSTFWFSTSEVAASVKHTQTAVYVRFSSSILLLKKGKPSVPKKDVFRLHDGYGSCHMSSPGISCLSDLASCFHSLK